MQTIKRTGYWRQLGRDIWKSKFLYILFLPVLAYYIIFRYWPMYGLVIAFQRYNIFDGIAGSPWVGLQNFRDFFGSIFFTRLLRNTIVINLFDLAFVFTMPIIFALLMNELNGIKFKRVVQTISYLPHFISTVVVVSMVMNFLALEHGLINNIRYFFGVERIHFLVEPSYFWGIFTTMNVWQSMGFGAIIYMAALTGIDTTLYEAAHIDGAGRLKQAWHITLPGLRNIIILMLVLRLGSFLSVGFESIVLMYNSQLWATADVFGTYIYRIGLEGAGGQPNYSLATAAGMFQSVIGLILIVTANLIARRYSDVVIW